MVMVRVAAPTTGQAPAATAAAADLAIHDLDTLYGERPRR
jgi:hypothetical protein